MKIKILLVLSLATMIFFAGCKSDTNTNTVNANTNANTTAVVTPTQSAQMNSMEGKKIEDALKAKGYNDLTVDTTTKPATLRGTYPKDKIAEVMQIATEANGGTPVKNEATGK